jgi:hypothetical protein
MDIFLARGGLNFFTLRKSAKNKRVKIVQRKFQ